MDLEMSGLWADSRVPQIIDDAEARYATLRSAAAAYLPLQLGLSCFSWVPQPAADLGREAAAAGRSDEAVGAAAGRWEARTFNISLFPHTGPVLKGGPVLRGAPPADQVCNRTGLT